MMPVKKNFDHEGADLLENYVRMKSEYRQQLGIPAMRLWHDLEYFEKRGLGLCQPVTATYKDLARITYLSSDSIKKALTRLKGVLCEVEIGTPIKGGKKATQIRRYKISELKSDTRAKRIIDYTPEHALRLARALKDRTFVYGPDMECNPYWNPTRTGRITSSRPPVQNDPEKVRIDHLKKGCGKGEHLIHCDFVRAEPTLIQQLIGYTFDEDPYELATHLLGLPEREAKAKVNMLAYCEYSAAIVKHWPIKAQEAFMPYAEALDSFKGKLWKASKASGRARRFVVTLGGSKIYADTGGKHNRGTIFNWVIQGSISDVVNVASLRIIESEEIDGDWHFCFPEHDAVYVIGKKSDAKAIKRIIEQTASDLRMSLKVRTEVF